MRKLLPALLIFIGAFSTAVANPGDTTWVQANKVNLDYYNNFDTKVKFPDGSKTYRQILQIFTLGEYACPAGTQYCHQWDYTVSNYVLTQAGDTAEISRFITPYANTGVPRFPSTWTQEYVFDVTDYYTILKDSAVTRILYSGYSGGFTANVKFAFIEGTPPRNVIGRQKLWSNYFTYGNAADPIANHVQPFSLNMPAGAKTAELKFTITGHGADQTDNCCEFSNNGKWHDYSVMLNNKALAKKLIYRDDCGLNELYPQGGTWIYNRANWCPGSSVDVYTHSLLNSASGDQVGIKFSDYTSTGAYGGFQIYGDVIYYGDFNKSNDASMLNIISPTSDKNFFRENPAGSKAMIKVKNTGASVISSMEITYQVKDSALATFKWTGNLAPLKDTLIELPELSALKNMSINKASGNFVFMVNISKVNGKADDDETNNRMQSNFIAAPNWPEKFVVALRTNNQGTSPVGISPSQTSWKIFDMDNKVVASRSNAKTNSTYNDTISLPTGMYKLSLVDGGCDGLHWWVYDQNPGAGVNAGSFGIKKADVNGAIALSNYTSSGTFRDDFGCGFDQYFSVKSSTNVGIAPANIYKLEIFPNPAKDAIRLESNFSMRQSASIRIVDITGKIVLNDVFPANESSSNINIQHLPAGIYQVIVENNQIQMVKKLSILK